MGDRFEQRDSRGDRSYGGGGRHRSSEGGYEGGNSGGWGSDTRGERRGDWSANRGGSDYSGSRSFGRGGGGRSSNYQRRDGYNSEDRGSRGGGYEQRGGGGGNGTSYRNYDSGDKSTMKILSSDVGRVIGRGGSTIKDLQSKSGARIKVHNRNTFDDVGNQTSVDLFGTTEERGKAEELINEITSQSRPSKQQRTYEDDSNE